MPDITKCANIVEAMKALEPNHLLATCLEREGAAVKHTRYTAVQMPDGRIGAMSLPGNLAFYRGENRIYNSCTASLFRIEKREEKVLSLLKTYDFLLFLNTLPEVRFYIENNYYFDPWALAQHYEFATPMIDLTNELAVAAFFATHYYDRVSKQFMLMEKGRGQIRCCCMLPDPDGCLRPIGLQPFARPGKQDGYGYWIPENEDFTTHSFRIEFEQDLKVNRRLEEAMLGGADYYFPNEMISRMAEIIKNTNAVTSMAIDAMVKDIADGNSYLMPVVTRDEIESVIDEKHIFVVDAPVICPEAMPPQFHAFRQERTILTRPAYTKGCL